MSPWMPDTFISSLSLPVAIQRQFRKAGLKIVSKELIQFPKMDPEPIQGQNGQTEAFWPIEVSYDRTS